MQIYQRTYVRPPLEVQGIWRVFTHAASIYANLLEQRKFLT